jgi:hypothetical protein
VAPTVVFTLVGYLLPLLGKTVVHLGVSARCFFVIWLEPLRSRSVVLKLSLSASGECFASGCSVSQVQVVSAMAPIVVITLFGYLLPLIGDTIAPLRCVLPACGGAVSGGRVL